MSDATPDPESKPSPERRGLIALFVDRPVLTLMAGVALIVLGMISFSRLPLRFLPSGLSTNQIRVWVPVRQNRSPEEVRRQVVEPAEALIRSIPGLRRVYAEADSNSARFSIELDESMDPRLAAAEVRDRVQRARLEWPDDVDRFFTWKEDGGSAPLAFLNILTPERNAEWNYLLEDVVRARLETVEGVGNVDVWGVRDETLKIWLDRDVLDAARVDLRDLLSRLGADNFAEPVGEVRDGRSRYLVRVDSKFYSTRDIEQFPVRPGLLLEDVALIERVPEEFERIARYDGKYTYTCMVRASSDANPVEACQKLEAKIEELKQDPRLAGLAANFLFNQGAFIEDGLETLVSTALQGALLALVALFLFLRNMRMTLAIALTIPLTLLIVGAWLYFSGSSLNIATMAGMTLAVGMVVDNSVVVLENVRRLNERGRSLRRACIDGAREVALPVSMATMTTVVVFLPLGFMVNSPAARTLMSSIGIPLSVALIGSLLVALLLMPAGVHALSRGRDLSRRRVAATDDEDADDASLAIESRWSPFFYIAAANRSLLRFSLKHRVLASGLALLVLFTAIPASQTLDMKAGTGGGLFRRGEVTVRMGFPRGLEIPDVEKLIETYERYVLEHSDEWNVKGVGGRYSRRGGRLDVYLADGTGPEETKEVQAKVLANFPRVPGVTMRMSDQDQGQGGGNRDSEKDDRNFVVRLWGRDSEYLMQRAAALKERLAAMRGVEEIEVPALESNQEVVVNIDRERLQDLGVRPETLFGTVATGLQGRELSRFEESGREIRVIAQYDNREKANLRDLKNTRVWAAANSFQKLDDLADIRFQESMDEIESRDGQVNVVLVGKRKPDVTARDMSSKLTGLMRTFPLEQGYRWSEDSKYREASQEITEILQSMLLSITLVFLLMGVLFESVILPISILITIPFALFGAVWSLVLFAGELDFMAVIGMVILCGIVVNNGIVLLDYIERLRRQGVPRGEAILQGTKVRLRPIFMTASTTVLGLLPMALFGDSGSDGISYVGLSIAVGGGLAFCTVFTAVAVPLAYTFADDFSRGLRRMALRAAR